MRTNLDEMASNVSGGIVKLIEKDVSVQRLCSAIIYRELQYASLTTMVVVSRNKKIRNEIAFHDYLALLSIMHVPSIICYMIWIYSLKYVVMLHKPVPVT